MGVVDIDITMTWIYRFSVFFTTKTMRIMKIHHWTSCGKNTTPSTELPRDFCAAAARRCACFAHIQRRVYKYSFRRVRLRLA